MKRSKVELIADDVAVAVKSIDTFERRRAGEKSEGGAKKPVARPTAPKQAPKPVIDEDDEPF